MEWVGGGVKGGWGWLVGVGGRGGLGVGGFPLGLGGKTKKASAVAGKLSLAEFSPLVGRPEGRHLWSRAEDEKVTGDFL